MADILPPITAKPNGVLRIDLADGVGLEFQPEVVRSLTDLLPHDHPEYEALLVIERWRREKRIEMTDLGRYSASIAAATYERSKSTIDQVERQAR